ncbi:hypothetical protein [Metabacillus fastidiosus]|uniref:hypothetical protein n=1 Tax=Metabacillus fastidiosus TaxID=1458 RepID=UPI002DBC34FF|nr:hypothetical protein [Metabacillus fastidiosus]MEC2074936.1 hypothetical protein [Metabacillus fastidiosus]
MFTRSLFIISLLYGTISGVVLALFLKLIEKITGDKVYTLLLNVDYIPVINRYQFSEIVEVIFHLIISVLLTGALWIFLYYRKITEWKDRVLFCLAICFVIGALLYPTTAFSDRTPPLLSGSSLIYWLIGHIVYGLILGVLLSRIKAD